MHKTDPELNPKPHAPTTYRRYRELNSAQLVVPLMLSLVVSGLILSLWSSHKVGEKLERVLLAHTEQRHHELSTSINLATRDHLLVLSDIARLPIIIQTAMQPESNLLNAADFLESVSILGGDYQLTVVDFSGTTIYSTRGGPATQYTHSPSLEALLAGRQEHSVDVRPIDSTHYWILAVPILVSGLPEGALIAEVPLSALVRDIFSSAGTLGRDYIEILKDGQQIMDFGQTLHTAGITYDLGDTGLKVRFHLDRKQILAEEHSFVLDMALAFLVISAITLVVAWMISKRFSERIITERNKTLELNQQIATTNHALEAEIRQHQATEAQLKTAKLAAEQANKTKSEFLANMSHEIRTPMNAILGMTELTLDSELNEQQEQYLAAVMSSATALLDILNDILDLSKIEAGKLDLEHSVFDLRTCVESTVQIFAPRTKEKGIELTCHIEPEVPSHAVGDAGRLRQVLVNMLGNATKFTEEGRIDIDVRHLSQREGQCEIEFTVRDTGIGIPTERQEAIFTAFSQADSSTTRRFGGTGLGLSISSLLVSMMDGRIGLESEEGEGSSFSFTVHLGLVDEAEQSAHSKDDVQPIETAMVTEGDAPQRWRILLVEDNAFNQMAITGLLKKWGHSIDVANNGREALSILAADDYDIVLMDVQMPVMDGVEATKAIREKEQESGNHVPIVGLTANAMAGDRERYLAAGMDAYSTKPVQSAKLLAALNEAIDTTHSTSLG